MKKEKLNMDCRDLFFNDEIEKTVLGNIINKPNLIYKLHEFPSNIFYSTVNSDAFEMLREIFSTKGNIDIVLIGDYLIKYKPKTVNMLHVTQMIELGFSSYNYDMYIEILIDLYTKRQIRQAVSGIDYSSESDTIKSEILTKMNSLYVIQQEEKTSEVVLNTVEAILSGEVKKGIPTGYNELDNKLMGFNPGELITIAARSQVGKTTFAINVFTCQVFNGYKAHYFSLEMPKTELVKAMLAIKGNIKSEYLRKNMADEIDQDRLMELANDLAGRNFEMHSDNSSIEFIESKIREEHIKGNCDIVYIDLLNRVTTKKKSGSRAEELGTITRALKQLAMELKIPIVILAQINRTAETTADKRPMLHQLKESGSIEEDSDLVIGLYRNIEVCRKGYTGKIDYFDDNPDYNPERIEITTLKSRYTGLGVTSMIYVSDYRKIKEKMR